MDLNNSQQLAVTHESGPMLVLAGPGSGKTAVITRRIQHLIEQCGAAPEKILVITFSKAAATEMKARFEKLTCQGYRNVKFGTFHAVFYNIIRTSGRYGGLGIITEEEKTHFLKDCIHGLNIPTDNENELAYKLGSAISAIKSESIALERFCPQYCSREDFGKIYHDYGEYLKSELKLDFDDMMILCNEIFMSDSECLEKWRACYEHILIDEFQDINRLQYELVKKLAAPENNLFAVGDDDQSIYGFRGARPDIMFEFQKDFPKSRRILLDTNYRCYSEILEPALKLVGHNRTRFKKRLKCNKGKGGRLEFKSFERLEDEHDFVTETIKEYMAGGNSPEQVAILYRMNHQITGLKRKLTMAGIPARASDSIPCIFEHWITADIVAYLKLAEDMTDRTSFIKIMNRPKRYITRDGVQRALSGGKLDIAGLKQSFKDRKYVLEAISKLEMNINFIKRLDIKAAIKFIRYAIGYEGYLRNYASEKGTEAEELLEILDELEESAGDMSSLEDWLRSMEEYREKEKNENGPAVSLMTFHASKGLEFDRVFIIDMTDGIIPQKHAETTEAIEEERRSLYVAITRARNEVYLLHADERHGRASNVSAFVTELEV